MDEGLVGASLADLDDDVARTGALRSGDDLNRTAERHDLTILELAELRERAVDLGLVVEHREDEDAAVETGAVVRRRDTESPDPAVGFTNFIRRLDHFPLLDAAEETALARRIENGARAVEQLRDERQPAERAHLERLVTDGARAKQRMVGCNVRLAIANAKDFKGRGLDFDDLVQAAMPGLIRAAEKFDHRKGFKFSTYATWWIRQSISRALADTGRTIRLPVHVVERLNAFRGARAKLETRLGREATTDELANALGWQLAEVAALTDLPTTVSLDAPLNRGGESFTVADYLASDTPTPYEETVETLRHEFIQELLEELDSRQREVIELRHGLRGAPLTLEEIGRRFGVTRERIRQLEKEALKTLRKQGIEKGFPV